MTELARRLFHDHKLSTCMVAGALVGVLIAITYLDAGFIVGTGGKWVRPDNDYIAYLVAWHYYVVDAWRFPIFDLPAMGYPEGGSVLFNDALPLTALPTKVLYHLSGVLINPFGWWIFLTYVLQGAMAARLVWAVGTRSAWAGAAAAALAIINTSFASRMGHTALSSHFLLLWALALHFECLKQARAKVWEMTAVLTLAILVNSYLFAMVFAFQLATLGALWLRGQLTLPDVRRTVLGIAGIVVVGIVVGYGMFLVNPTTMKSQGFGLYSWNLAALLLPPDGLFGYLVGIPRDATHGQYEGEAYVGRGALLLFALALVFTPLKALGAIRRYWVYVSMLVLLAIYAASNLVYAGSVLVVEYPLPQVAIDLGNYFRATGRFVWPLAYSVMILPVALIFRWWPTALALPAAVFAVYVQYQEGLPGLEWRRHLTRQVAVDLIDTPRLDSWLVQHQRLWQYPSWACGGIGGSKRSWGNEESNRELQVQLAAARRGVPTNSVYTSRLLKSCPVEFTWGPNPQLEEGVLYLLGPEMVAATPTLAELARSNACVTLDWGIVCSRKWQEMAAAGPPAVRK